MTENNVDQNSSDPDCHHIELESLRQREQDLIRQRSENETEFGQQRAKFMDLFRQKEDELKSAQETLDESKRENKSLEEQVQRLTREIDDIKTAAAISEVNKEDEIAKLQRRLQEEVASLQHIMKEAVSQAQQSATDKYQQERVQWLKHQEKLEIELQELRSKLSQEREGILASITKTLQKRVATVGMSREEQDSMEHSMKRAQEDADLLRSVVNPLEEEIESLKSQLTESKDRVTELEALKESVVVPSSSGQLDGSIEIEEKVKELNHSLQTEKASRTDLEMYVAVLNTQKGVLQEDVDKLRSQLHELCKLLEQEKLEHNDLKRTWQMANDQFLESQRLMMMDMRRMESVLSSEQQRQITEMKKKDNQRLVQEKRVRELEEMQERELKEQEQRKQEERIFVNLHQAVQPPNLSDVPLRSSPPAASLALDLSRSNPMQLKVNDVVDGIVGDACEPHDIAVNQDTPTVVDDGGTQASHVSSGLPSLTEAQQKALLDPTPESEISKTLLATAKAKMEAISMIGKRLVSDKEWEMLQKEVSAAREKVGKPCDMCANYESQLQAAQENEKKVIGQLHTLERHLQLERQALASQDKYVAELEANLKNATENTEMQINTLQSKLQESEKFIQTVKGHFERAQTELHEYLKLLSTEREEVQLTLTKLQEENDSLVGKHSKHSQELQEESIDLPNTLEELQLLLLKYREDVITAKVAEEHVAEQLKSEILFLRSQIVAEQQERTNIEESLTQEIQQLQEQLAIQNSLNCELHREKDARQEVEDRLHEASEREEKDKQQISDLEAQVKNLASAKGKLEQDVMEMKAKVISLQVELDNSEVVQRDFVKLSQSLQIQLEKIRTAEHQVRWQHEEDVEDCASCHQPFSVTRRKHHCKHCGQIFCTDCLTKTVNSGPSLRPSKVCDVCHTILVRDATPYFSTEPLHTPE